MKIIAKSFDELTTKELYEILKTRSEIFMLEQQIICQDMDDVDYESIHYFYMENDRVTAYLRAFYKDNNPDVVKVGRVVTLRHGIGTGKKLMEESIIAIKDRMKCKTICMDAQKHAVGFYEKFGFKVTSDEFLEEGVVHVTMELEL